MTDVSRSTSVHSVRRFAGRAARKLGLRRTVPAADPLSVATTWLTRHAEDIGYLRSVRERAAVDATGAPLPWYTYPCIEYLRGIDLTSTRVFEFGAGNSSRFWAARTAEVVSVEPDEEWHSRVEAAKLNNQTVLLRPDRDGYVGALEQVGGVFDVVVVDGNQHRRASAEAAARAVAEDGFVVLDNSDWYPKSAKVLRDAGLIQIDFCGAGPINPYAWVTSLFLKPGFHPIPAAGRQPAVPVGGLDQTADPE